MPDSYIASHNVTSWRNLFVRQDIVVRIDAIAVRREVGLHSSAILETIVFAVASIQDLLGECEILTKKVKERVY